MVEGIIWTQKALYDLRTIFNYIVKDSKLYADRTIRTIILKAGSIKRFPLAGRTVLEFEDETIREVFYKQYRIIYKLEGSLIYIVRIYHSARLLTAL